MSQKVNTYFSEAFNAIKVPLDSPLFYQRAFTFVCKNRKKGDDKENSPMMQICKEEYDSLSRRLDISKIQDSPSVRNVLRCRAMVNALIDEKGEINISHLNKAIEALRLSLFSLGPYRQYDAKKQEHLLRSLIVLQESKDMQRLLKNIGKPYSNRYAEQLIKETLQLSPSGSVNDPQARQAALLVWLCYLRQNVGSCFATAPAILICEEQPDALIKDIAELFGTGRLKRTFGGVEYSVPLSSSWGAGDLRRLIPVNLGSSENKIDLWHSPGLLAGLEVAGVIEPALPLAEKIEQVKSYFFKILKELPKGQQHLLISPEDFLKKAILYFLGLTEADLVEYENRPQAMITGSLMVQAQNFTAGGKSQTCRIFYVKFEDAKTAFKALAENALLKSWEYSLASFSETKLQFANWNLYASLGLGPQEEGGIGNSLFQILKKKLEQTNQQIQEIQYDYDQALGMVRYLETRMRTASSEKEAEWIKLEYRTRRYEFERIEEDLQKLQFKAKNYASLFDPLVDMYMSLFPRYFQEVYDADMHEISSTPYDDSPAGFRLLYKHGRSNSAQWNRIENANEFIDSLAAFFVAAEMEITSTEEMEGLQNEISEITTAIVLQVRTPEFLETAFQRMAKAHHTAPIKNPLEHLDKIDKKPWAYTSGGTMDTLVSCYWKRDQKPTEVGRWVENPMELLVFLAETIKQLPPKITDEYVKNPNKSMLMHSPTHAFILKPGLSTFRACWQLEGFMYTAIRDKIIKPAEKEIDNIALDQEMAHYLVEKLSEHVSMNFRHYFKQTFSYLYGGMTPTEFRQHIVHGMIKERGLGFGRSDVLSTEDIDSMLYTMLPLFPQRDLHDRVRNIMELLPGVDASIMENFEALWSELPSTMLPGPILNAKLLQDIVKAFLCLILEETSSQYDYHLHVSLAAKKLGYALPMPIIFADTNWARDEFGFVVSPGTGKLELWRVDYCGTTGVPMTVWDQWLDGSRKDRTWGFYTRPYEYS